MLFYNTIFFSVTAAVIFPQVRSSLTAPPVGTQSILDLSLIESTPKPPIDLDITKDHTFESYNILGNESWIITTRNGAHSPKWVYESKADTIVGPIRADVRKSRRASGADQVLWGVSTSSGSRCPYPGNRANTNDCIRLREQGRAGLLQYLDSGSYMTYVYRDQHCTNFIFKDAGGAPCWTNLDWLSLLRQDW